MMVRVCVCVHACVWIRRGRGWFQRHTAGLHVPSPQPASGWTKGMMSCLANNKSVWVRRALLSASSSFIQPSINHKPYPLYSGWGKDNNKPGGHIVILGERGKQEAKGNTSWLDPWAICLKQMDRQTLSGQWKGDGGCTWCHSVRAANQKAPHRDGPTGTSTEEEQ